ncbi:MAG: AMMECR1 domain-containing protein [Candidatus Omnitrophota bacterium]
MTLGRKILAAVTILSYFSTFAPSTGPSAASASSVKDLTYKEKKFLAGYVYFVLGRCLDGEAVPKIPVPETGAPDPDYDIVFVSVYYGNTLIGCQGNSYRPKDINRVLADIRKATINVTGDRRFKKDLTKDGLKDVSVVISFLYNGRRMAQNDLAYLKRYAEPGIHGLSVSKGGKHTYFIPSVMITANIGLETAMKQLSKKAGLPEDGYLGKDIEIYLYDSVVFRSDARRRTTDLYRFNVPVDAHDITRSAILERISLGYGWFLNNVDPGSGMTQYAYSPARDLYSEKNNHPRQMAALWAITELRRFLRDGSSDELIEREIDYYLGRLRDEGGYSFFVIDGRASIAYNAFMILALLNTDRPDKGGVLKRLGDGILAMQDPDGSYDTDFIKKGNDGIDYAPGEAMLGLMHLYAATGDEAYLGSVKKAFPYYRDHWRANKNAAFIPWHTQTYYLLYRHTKDRSLADFIFEMNDWSIDNYQVFESGHPDEIGGFTKGTPRGCSTSVYLEGINDAYRLARETGDTARAAKYSESIRLGTRFILQTQFTKENSFYLKNASRAAGGFRQSLERDPIRVDYVQHASRALVKAYESGLFGE